MRDKLKIAAVSIGLAIALGGCGSNSGVPRGITELTAYRVKEWISPDGVHYWVVEKPYRFGMAPRFDHEGNLIVDPNPYTVPVASTKDGE